MLSQLISFVTEVWGMRLRLSVKEQSTPFLGECFAVPYPYFACIQYGDITFAEILR